MSRMMSSLRHNMGGLVRLSGRDTPALFWPWAILVFVVATVASLAVMLPPMFRAMISMMEAIEADPGRPGDPLPPEVLDAFIAQYAADLGALWLPLAAINLLSVALLAAPVVRRLHDSDRNGAWGLMPLPFVAFSIVSLPAGLANVGGGRALSPLETAASTLSAFYWVAIIALIFLLAGEGTRGPNRFGPDPRSDR